MRHDSRDKLYIFRNAFVWRIDGVKRSAASPAVDSSLPLAPVLRSTTVASFGAPAMYAPPTKLWLIYQSKEHMIPVLWYEFKRSIVKTAGAGWPNVRWGCCV
jgi:hypothetical protein